MPDVLTQLSQVKCVHGATATVKPSNSAVTAEKGAILVASDVHIVAGCPFMKGTQPSPCVRIEWSGGAQNVTIGGQAVLTNQSQGQCIGLDNSLQGVAVIVNSKKAKAL